MAQRLDLGYDVVVKAEVHQAVQAAQVSHGLQVCTGGDERDHRGKRQAAGPSPRGRARTLERKCKSRDLSKLQGRLRDDFIAFQRQFVLLRDRVQNQRLINHNGLRFAV